jgi:hypothetical protein
VNSVTLGKFRIHIARNVIETVYFSSSDGGTYTGVQKTPENIDGIVAVEGSEVLHVSLPSMHFAGASSFGSCSSGQSVT